MKKKVEPNPTHCFDGLDQKLKNKEQREMCQDIPNDKSCLRLFGAILQGYSEDWISGKLYLSEPLERIRENLKMPIPFEPPRNALKPCSVG